MNEFAKFEGLLLLLLLIFYSFLRRLVAYEKLLRRHYQILIKFLNLRTLSYHNMKGKKEDDDSTKKPTNESTRVDHFANLLIHAELEQLYKTLESNQK